MNTGPMNLGKWLGLAVSGHLLLPVIASCGELAGANTAGLDRAECPELAGGAMNAGFSANAKADATIRAFVQASGDLLTARGPGAARSC